MFKNLMNKVKNLFADDLSEASVEEIMDVFMNMDEDEARRLEAAEQLTDFSSTFMELDTDLPSTIRLANDTYGQLLDMLEEENDEEWVYGKALYGMNEIINVCRYEMDKRLLRDSAETIIACLSDEEEDTTRERAAGLLGSLESVLPESTCEEAIHAIQDNLDEPSDELRADFIFALGTFGNKAHFMWDELTGFLDDPSAKVRNNTLSALWMIGHENPNPEVIEHIIELMLNDRSGSVRSNAADALGYLGSGFPDVVDALIEALEDDEARHMALYAFSALGEEADAAVPHVEAFFGDEDHDDTAETVLQGIGTPAARAALRAHGRDEE